MVRMSSGTASRKRPRHSAKFAIGFQASGDVSGVNAFESAGKQRDARGEESQADV